MSYVMRAVQAASHLLASGNGNCKGGREVEIILEKNLFFLILSIRQNKSRDVDFIWKSFNRDYLLQICPIL